MERQGEYVEIDLVQMLKALWQHGLVVILAMVLCGSAGFGLAYWVIPPKYQASALMYVNNSAFSVGNTSISLSDLSASKTLVATYIEILNTRLTLNDVIEKAGVDYTFGEIRGMINAQAVNDTEIFRVTVTSEDPYEAEKIANTITVVLPDKIAQIVDGSSVRTVDYAVIPTGPSAPSCTKYAILGMIMGVLLSGGVVVLRELLDDQIHSEEDVTACGLPILAAVPDMLDVRPGKGYGSYYAAAEGKKR